jgi:hypothetical protein
MELVTAEDHDSSEPVAIKGVLDNKGKPTEWVDIFAR